MKGYRQQFCPVARASEIFAERWTPIIIRNLLVGCRSFTEILEGAPGIPRSLLTTRLRSLESRGLVRREPHGRGYVYSLTQPGMELQAVCDALGAWGQRWLDIAPAQLDPGVLLWAIARFFDVSHIAPHRLVVRVSLTDQPKSRFWWVLHEPEAELCRTHPGFDDDVIVHASAESLARWHAGHVSLATSQRNGAIRFEGTPVKVRAFKAAGGQSPFASIKLAAPGG